jgi:hypothetical protein
MSLIQWRIHANADGSLTLAYPSLLGGQTSRWVEVEPGLFQNQERGAYLSYREDSRGRITHVYTKTGEEGVLERVAWHEGLAVQASILVFLINVFAGVLVGRLVAWLVGAARRARPRNPEQQAVRTPGGRALRLAIWFSVLLSGLGLLFLAGLASSVLYSMNVRAPEVPPYMIGLLVLPLIAVALTLAVVSLTVLAWVNRSGTLLGRIQLLLVSLAGPAFVWFAWYWNLLGFKL